MSTRNALALVAGLALGLGLPAAPVRGEPPADAPAPPPAARPESAVTPERLLAELRALPTARAANAGEENTRGLRATEELILDRLRGFGYTPTTHDIDFLGSSREGRGDPDRVPWRNIIVEIPGTTRPDELLVFSAHFDAVPNSPGADDDGTGTVALLEMARLLKGRPMQRTLRLCFFNLEEVGLVGSRAYVQSIEEEIKGEIVKDSDGTPKTPAERLPPTKKFLGMASIDGVGYFTDKPDSQRSPIPANALFTPPTVGDFLAMGGILRHRRYSRALDKAMREAAPELKTVVVDFLPIAPPDLLRSDHAPFLGMGVPAVILADTANFRSPHYHKPSDTVETLDMERYTLVVRALVGAAHRLAGPVGGPLIALEPPAPRKPDPETPAQPPASPPQK